MWIPSLKEQHWMSNKNWSFAITNCLNQCISLTLSGAANSFNWRPSIPGATLQFVSISLQATNSTTRDSCDTLSEAPVERCGGANRQLVMRIGSACFLRPRAVSCITQGHNPSFPVLLVLLLHDHSRLYFTNQLLFTSSSLARSMGR